MPSSARSNSASATKSRSLTASSEFVEHGGEAEGLGRRRRIDRQRRAGQRAGAERRHVEPLDGGRRGGRRRGPAPSRGPAGGGPAAPAGPAGRGCSRAGRCRRPPRPGRAARPRRSTTRRATSISSRLHHSRRSVATWSLRLRAVCSLAPAGPASSVTRRSTAVWMSSSLWANANDPSASSASTCVERGEDGVALVVVEQPGPGQAADVGPRAGDVVAPQAAVERQADGVGHQGVGRAAGEAPVPERRRRRVVWLSHRRRPARRAGAGGRPGRRRSSPGPATHSSVSSPATVPSRPSRPLRSSAEATTWAQPGGVRSTTRLADDGDLADPLPEHPAQLVERRDAVGLQLGQGVDGLARRGRGP